MIHNASPAQPDCRVYQLYVATAPDGRKYVGCTGKTVDERWRGHRPYWSDGHAFGHALYVIGKDAFAIEHVASAVGAAAAVEAEAQLIRQHNSRSPHGFNLSSGGPLKGAARRPQNPQQGAST